MNVLSRRRFLQAASASAASLAAANQVALAPEASLGSQQSSAKFRLGIVTYNIAAHWDLPTILRVCKSVGLSPVELRTTHKHGVEPTLTKDQRKEVKQRYADTGVEYWGCGPVSHSPPPQAAVATQTLETCTD